MGIGISRGAVTVSTVSKAAAIVIMDEGDGSETEISGCRSASMKLWSL